MQIKLQPDDTFRVVTGYKETNFIDIRSTGFETIAVDLFSLFQYIEIRKLKYNLRVFLFKKKADKKECDFGEWEDAEVVFAQNEQINHK